MLEVERLSAEGLEKSPRLDEGEEAVTLGRSLAESAVSVIINEAGAFAFPPEGPPQHITWDALERVVIEIDYSGPWAGSLWWVLEGGGHRCAFPHGATGASEALKGLGRRLPGFDWEAMIADRGSTTKSRWEKAGTG